MKDMKKMKIRMEKARFLETSSLHGKSWVFMEMSDRFAREA
jgi:hypothetical protein